MRRVWRHLADVSQVRRSLPRGREQSGVGPVRIAAIVVLGILLYASLCVGLLRIVKRIHVRYDEEGWERDL